MININILEDNASDDHYAPSDAEGEDEDDSSDEDEKRKKKKQRVTSSGVGRVSRKKAKPIQKRRRLHNDNGIADSPGIQAVFRNCIQKYKPFEAIHCLENTKRVCVLLIFVTISIIYT